MYLYENQLTGEIPPGLGSLTNLKLLWIHENGLSGPLPEEFGKLTALENLRAANNGLSGELPQALANLQALTRLELEGNSLSGYLPSAMGEMRELQRLWLDGNHDLTGLLPRSMLQLERMVELSYGATGLCAHVDDEFQRWLRMVPRGYRRDCSSEVVERLVLADLHEKTDGPSWTNGSSWGTETPLDEWHGVVIESGRVVELHLTDNGLAGPIPPDIVNLTELRKVDLGGNDLFGRFPATVSWLSELEELRVDDNEGLEGALPFAMTRLEKLRVLDYAGSGLCASPSASFQTWFSAIAQAAGATCENPGEVMVSLPIVYLTQSVQAPSGRVRLVANRDALLRVFLTAEEPRGYFEPEVVAVFTLRGVEVYRAVMTRSDDRIPGEADESDLGVSYNSVIPAEAIVPGARMVVESLRTSDNGTGYYYGAAASVNGYVRGRARKPGWASMGKASMPELAHEVGHNVSLSHAPCGDPPDADRAYPYRDGSIGVWGYDFRDGSLVSPERRKDIMGYCYSQGWLSDFHYRRVIDHRNRVEGDVAGALRAAGSPRTEALVLWGGVVDGEPWIEPPFSMRAGARLPDQPGPYRIRGFGADRETLFSLDFTPGEDKFGDKYFFFTIPIEPDWADSLERITLTGPDGLAAVDREDRRAMTVVTEPGTGRIRALLRDWGGALPETLRDPDLAVVTTRGLRDAVRLRR